MKQLKRITLKNIMDWDPCYTEEEIKDFIKIIGFKKSATPLEILRCDHKNKQDLVWILLRLEVIPEKELHKLSIKFAADALKADRVAGREPHPDSWNALKVKKKWLKGKATDEELQSARSAAQSAAWSAAEASAWSAAEAAAKSAAWSAAWSAQSAAWSAQSAAWSAAEASAWSAAEAAAKSAAEAAARSAAQSAAEAAEAAEAAAKSVRTKQLERVKLILEKI